MTIPAIDAKIPAAWLRPLPAGYKIPLWRWILLPAASLMLHRTRGVWVGGELSLRGDGLYFAKSTFRKTSTETVADWQIRLAVISDVIVSKGMASETIEIHHPGGIVKIMGARSAEFVARLKDAVAGAQAPAAFPEPPSEV